MVAIQCSGGGIAVAVVVLLHRTKRITTDADNKGVETPLHGVVRASECMCASMYFRCIAHSSPLTLLARVQNSRSTNGFTLWPKAGPRTPANSGACKHTTKEKT